MILIGPIGVIARFCTSHDEDQSVQYEGPAHPRGLPGTWRLVSKRVVYDTSFK